MNVPPTDTEQLQRLEEQLEIITATIAQDRLKADDDIRLVLANLNRIQIDMENLHLPGEVAPR